MFHHCNSTIMQICTASMITITIWSLFRYTDMIHECGNSIGLCLSVSIWIIVKHIVPIISRTAEISRKGNFECVISIIGGGIRISPFALLGILIIIHNLCDSSRCTSCHKRLIAFQMRDGVIEGFLLTPFRFNQWLNTLPELLGNFSLRGSILLILLHPPLEIFWCTFHIKGSLQRISQNVWLFMITSHNNKPTWKIAIVEHIEICDILSLGSISKNWITHTHLHMTNFQRVLNTFCKEFCSYMLCFIYSNLLCIHTDWQYNRPKNWDGSPY